MSGGQMVSDETEDVLRFWFATPDADVGGRQLDWWFGGGADPEIIARFPPLLARASRAELDVWADSARSRLALIIVLDQFARTIHRGTPDAFAQDSKALALAREGIACGHYAALTSPWQKTFFFLPLSHSEDVAAHETVVQLADALVAAAPPQLRRILEFSAGQAHGHRDVIRRFGRHPHRNAILGRHSTPEEVAFLAAEKPVHTRRFPG